MRILRAIRRHAAQQSVAYLALFISMTGTAGAASAMWTGANIVPGSITGSNIAGNTITSTNIQDATITGSDIAPGSVTATDLAAGVGGASTLAKFDSGDTTYTEDAWAPFNAADYFAAGPTNTLASVQFTTAQDGWVDFRGQIGSDSYSNDTECAIPADAQANNLAASGEAENVVTVLIDSHPVWSAGGGSVYPGTLLTTAVVPTYLGAGTHTLTMTTDASTQCAYYADAVSGRELAGTPSGSYTISDIHLDVAASG